MKKINIDHNEINSYLGYRYCPRGNFKINEDIVAAKKYKDKYLSYTQSQLVSLGSRAISKSFDECVNKYSSSKNIKHFIPLSGGIDSRFILGELLKRVDKDQIITLTYGVPGALDYEIGSKVAKKMGVRNIRIDLSPDVFSWTDEELMASAENYENPSILFRGYDVYRHVFKNESFDENYVFWSGFMGDSLTSLFILPKTESLTWEESLERFVNKNFKRSKIIESNFDPKTVLPSKPILDRDILSYDEQLNYFVRQPFYLQNSVSPKNIFSHVESPYLQNNFLKFILNVPRESRDNRKLFIKIFQQRHPELFSLPFQSSYGLKLNSNHNLILGKKIFTKLKEELYSKLKIIKPSSKTQFFDWNSSLRNSKRLNGLVKNNLASLADRKIINWVDIESYYKNQKDSKNFGENIRRLISLEIFLKLEDKK